MFGTCSKHLPHAAAAVPRAVVAAELRRLDQHTEAMAKAQA